MVLKVYTKRIHPTLGKLNLQPGQSVNQSSNLHLVRDSLAVAVVILYVASEGGIFQAFSVSR